MYLCRLEKMMKRHQELRIPPPPSKTTKLNKNEL